MQSPDTGPPAERLGPGDLQARARGRHPTAMLATDAAAVARLQKNAPKMLGTTISSPADAAADSGAIMKSSPDLLEACHAKISATMRHHGYHPLPHPQLSLPHWRGD